MPGDAILSVAIASWLLVPLLQLHLLQWLPLQL